MSAFKKNREKLTEFRKFQGKNDSISNIIGKTDRIFFFVQNGQFFEYFSKKHDCLMDSLSEKRMVG